MLACAGEPTNTSPVPVQLSNFRPIHILPYCLASKSTTFSPFPKPWFPGKWKHPPALQEENSWEQTDRQHYLEVFWGLFLDGKADRREVLLGDKMLQQTRGGLHWILSLEGLKKAHRLRARVALSWAASSSERKTSADSALKTFGRTLCSGMQSAWRKRFSWRESWCHLPLHSAHEPPQ